MQNMCGKHHGEVIVLEDTGSKVDVCPIPRAKELHHPQFFVNARTDVVERMAMLNSRCFFQSVGERQGSGDDAEDLRVSELWLDGMADTPNTLRQANPEAPLAAPRAVPTQAASSEDS